MWRLQMQLLITGRALIGFVLSLTPLSCDLMGWRGAGGNGAASMRVLLNLSFYSTLQSTKLTF